MPQTSDELISNYEHYMQEKLMEWFPKQELAQRPSWITDEAWIALKETKSMRRYARRSNAWEKRAFLQQVFSSWRSSTASTPSHGWLKAVQLARAWAQRRAEILSAQTKHLLQRDEAAFLQRCIDTFETQCADANATDLWKVLKKHLPKMKDKVRSKAMRSEETQSALEQHFAENEKAQHLEDRDLQKSLRQRSQLTNKRSHEVQVELQNIPTLQELEQALRKAKNGKACFGSANPEWMLAAPRERLLWLCILH